MYYTSSYHLHPSDLQLISNHSFHKEKQVISFLLIASMNCLQNYASREIPICLYQLISFLIHLRLNKACPFNKLEVTSNIMNKSVVFCLTLLMAALEMGQGLSVPLNIGPSIKYSSSGTHASITGTSVFPMSTYSGPNTVNPLLYSIPLLRAMNDTSYKSTISVQQIYCQLNSGEFNLYFNLDTKYQNILSIQIYSTMMNRFTSLTLRYLVVASVWATFSGWWRQYTVTPYQTITSSTPYSYSIAVDFIPAANTVKMFSVLTGFHLTATDPSNELSLLLDVTRTGTSSAQVTFSTLSSTPVELKVASFSQWSIDQDEILAIPGRITMGTFSANTGGSLTYLDSGNIVRDYNTIMGLRGFHINNEAFLSWNLTLSPSVSISGTSSNSFLYFNFIYLILQQNWCDVPAPYLYMPNLTCYDVCPLRLYEKDISLTCQLCLYDCYQCDTNTNCSSCNDTLDFREMNNATGRCVPIAGYYDDGMNHSAAVPCPSPCLTCSSAVVCASCFVGYYLSGSSSCLACSPNCFNCTSSALCVSCLPPYTLNSSNLCDLVCGNFILNCSTCAVVANSTDVICLTCQLGFSLVNSSTCSVICGDGILASSEVCDDGNGVVGDGCNSSCQVEQSFYCVGTVGNISSCFPCGSNCLNCTNSSSCTLCQHLYVPISGVCQPNCSEVTYCLTCHIGTPQAVICDSCSNGYTPNDLNECVPICGDGNLAVQQDCEDGNLVNGDGCDDKCKVQTYFSCSPVPNRTISQCFLTNFTLAFQTLLKNPDKNSGQMWFDPSPGDLPLYDTLNWASLLSISNPEIAVTSVHYDSSSHRVVADFDYSSSLTQDVGVSFDGGSDVRLTKLANFTVSRQSSADNNQALVFYEEGQYAMASIIKYMAIGASSIALLLAFLGLIAGRLVGLECLAVLQLSFLSLLTLTDVSPSFASLSYLVLSFGYNKVGSYEMSQSIDRPFKQLTLSRQLAMNYNWMALLPLVSLLLALVCWVWSGRCDKRRKSFYSNVSGYLFGEYTLYFFLCFCYLGYASLSIQLKFMSQGPPDYAGLSLGLLALVFGAVYAVIYVRRKGYFLEFRHKLREENHFYLLIMLERVLSSAILVFLDQNYIGNVVIISMYTFLTVFLLLKQPYAEGSVRPLANYVVVIVVQAVFIVTAYLHDPKQAIAIYGPTVVVGLLLLTTLYSGVALALSLKECCEQHQLQKENEEKTLSGDHEIREFASKLLKQTQCGILRSSSISVEESRGEQSPSRVQVSALRSRLDSLKMGRREEVGESLVGGQPMQVHFNSVLEMNEDSI